MVASVSSGSRALGADSSRLVLVTGFDPFGGDPDNPSWQAAARLHGGRVADHLLWAAQLPTRFDTALPRLQALLAEHRPVLVLCLGLAATRRALSIERVAINVQDARIADNAGAQPIDEPVVAGGPAAYFSSLPIKAMRAAIEADGMAAEVSQTAGTFVCNHVFYGLMHELATVPSYQGMRGGFVHVPPLADQASHGMPLDDMVQALRIGIHTALTVQDDWRQAAGAVD